MRSLLQDCIECHVFIVKVQITRMHCITAVTQAMISTSYCSATHCDIFINLPLTCTCTCILQRTVEDRMQLNKCSSAIQGVYYTCTCTCIYSVYTQPGMLCNLIGNIDDVLDLFMSQNTVPTHLHNKSKNIHDMNIPTN